MERTKEKIRTVFDEVLRKYSAMISDWFNNQALKRRKRIAVTVGALVAVTCVTIILRAFSTTSNQLFSPDPIIQPKLLPMQPLTKNEFLIPLGKMKGEIDGEFEAFYLAVDTAGVVYMNRHPPFEDTFKKSEEWTVIPKAKLQEYERQLHFLPNKKKGIKR